MFGYIRCSKGELKVNEYETYKAVYCSLCKYLGKKYGILSRFILSYDFTFLSMLNMALTEECPEYKAGRCTFNPLKKCNYCVNTDPLDMSAAAATVTFYYKICDNISDSKGLKRLAYKFAKLLFSKKHKKAASLYPDIEKALSEYMEKQRALEEKSCADIDMAADPTATMLSRLLSCCTGDKMQKRVLERMGYCIGRYIYLLDAACDLEKDIKCGNYNVLKYKFTTKKQAAERIIPQLYASVNEAQKAFELLEIKRYKTIIGNAVYLGFEETFLKELKDEKSV